MNTLLRGIAACCLFSASFLTGCTTEQAQAVNNAISSECAALPAQTTLGIQIANGTSVVSSQSALITQLESSACPIIAAGVQSAISAINAAGQTATVTVTTAPGAASLGARRMVRFQVTPDKQVFVVSPGGLPTLSSLFSGL